MVNEWTDYNSKNDRKHRSVKIFSNIKGDTKYKLVVIASSHR